MFVGHYAVALVLIALVQGVDPAVALVGVGLPDLLLGAFLLAGIEDVHRDADSPLWTDVTFRHYPYSHSLVAGGAVWTALAVPLAVLAGPGAGAVFVVAAVSHWVLDAVVHDGDLPVVGLGEDWTSGLGDYWTVGLGLWRWPRLSFVVEYALFAGAAVLVVPGVLLVPVLIVGALFHAMTVNASFGLASTNPAYDAVAKRVDLALGTSNPAVVETLFATHVIGGYVGITVALWLVLGS